MGNKKTSFIIPPSGLETKKNRSGLLGIIIGIGAVAAIIVLVISLLLKDDTLKTAINEFADGDYVSSIKILNRLSHSADMRSSEKIYYFRCRAIYRIAAQLEKEFHDELLFIITSKKGSAEFVENKNKIEDELKDINEELKSDLVVKPGVKQGRIFPGGRFYDEFLARHRDSRYFQELDFEIFEYVITNSPDKKIPQLIRFYNKYPETDYINRLVTILFDSIKQDEVVFNVKNNVIFEIIVTYLKRYPTSSVAGRIFRCKGNNVNLRSSPTVKGDLVDKIKKDEILIQVEKSMKASLVGTKRDYWYKIVSLQGTKGWIFGKFLTPLDLSKYHVVTKSESWKLAENFEQWIDSHTPQGWKHIPGGNKEGIDFVVVENKKIAVLNSAKSSKAGLFNTYATTKAFKIETKARHKKGNVFTCFAYALSPGKVFFVKLTAQHVNVSGRIIPFVTKKWHEYRLESGDGAYASLYIDGEKVSGKIRPAALTGVTGKGLYVLYSAVNESSYGEMAYIKVK